METAAKGKAKRRHLSAGECSELSRSPAGSSSLTQPHSVSLNQGRRDPHRGLYPHTPTKRRKCASATSSPATQKGINQFFPVTRVLTSSPCKSQVPSTSTTYSNAPRALFPKDELELDEEDDISLLDAVSETQYKPFGDEEIDDASLLLAENTDYNEQMKKEEVDYFEGVTSEMFDEDFEPCAIETHYGLLGSSKKNLLKPSGCVNDLPYEVLRQVLSQVPAQDLYRSVQFVCHRWRNVVQDPKFLPYKKQYYRYMMQESDTVQEVQTVMKNNDLIIRAHHCIRALVVLMAQHQPAQRFNPVDILENVKKHRLFPQAEASIRLRIPVIQKKHNLGIQGTNPYAAMAVILLLSENVDDVHALVSLLHSCMSYTAISEYLHCTAMMLLALKRNTGAFISNRLHYNIYYVLHLMENGPFAVTCDQSSGRPQINLTTEQQMVLSHDIQPDHVLKIMAFAGTGKTTTLVKYAEQRPHLRFLYMSFNKSVAEEAKRRFPSNVECKTVHSLAFRDVGLRYQINKKLTFNVKPFTINMVLPKGRGGFLRAKIVVKTLETFMASTDIDIDTSHVPSSHTTKSDKRLQIPEEEKVLYAQDAREIWIRMKNVHEKSNEAFYMPHDGYLKLWQLSRPRLSERYDVIFIDEAQDCTPAILDIMLSQDCGKILVGDPHQQIYTFRGAVNALDTVQHTHIYYLTQSFRFGSEIAYVGSAILRVCKNVQKILVGGRQKGRLCNDASLSSEWEEIKQTAKTPARGKTAILCRTNLSVFSEAAQLTDANSECRIHFVGGINGIGLNRIMDVWRIMQDTQKLQKGQKYEAKSIRDPLLRCLARKADNPLLALKQYANQTEDRELEAKLSIVEKYKNRIPELVMRIKHCNEEDYVKADFILSTVHKAKGMEFDTVVVMDDFVRVPASRHNMCFNEGFDMDRITGDEWNLMYVAVTRAQNSLVISNSIRRLLSMDGEVFLHSSLTSELSKDDVPLDCSEQYCPNRITPGSAFVMSRDALNCSDGMTRKGVLCERCVWARLGPIAFLQRDDVLSMPKISERINTVRHHIMLMALF